MTPKAMLDELIKDQRAVITANFFSQTEADSCRVSLYREKKKLELVNSALADRIKISRGSEADINGVLYTVSISVMAAPASVIKTSPDGTTEQLREVPLEQHPELLRAIKLMTDANAPQEDIDAFKEQFIKERGGKVDGA